jgi:hypothetical protein
MLINIFLSDLGLGLGKLPDLFENNEIYAKIEEALVFVP